MPSPQEIIQDAIAILHAEFLKPLGFRKSGETWCRNAEWPQVINIQNSSSNTQDFAKITINLGVSVPQLRTAMGGTPIESNLKEYDCEVRVRIGQLLPDGGDHWWSITSADESQTLAASLSEVLKTYGLPFLESMSTLPAIADEFVRRENHTSAAIACLLVGRRDDAETHMAAAVRSTNKMALPRLKRLAARHSLSLPTL